MNLMRLLAPDYFLGKLLVTARAIADIIIMLIRQPSQQSLHFARIILRIKPRFTMVTNGNLIGLYHLVVKANQLDLPGDLVECGVWNGGSAAIMGYANARSQRVPGLRALYLFDSFQGLPKPGERDGKMEREMYFQGWNQGSVSKVQQAFQSLQLNLEKVHIVPGWFDATLSTAPLDEIAVLHIDADWYDSVKIVLMMLYEKIVPGGFVVLDDYGRWQGCRKAVEDFLVERGIHSIEIVRINQVGGYFRKPLA